MPSTLPLATASNAATSCASSIGCCARELLARRFVVGGRLESPERVTSDEIASAQMAFSSLLVLSPSLVLQPPTGQRSLRPQHAQRCGAPLCGWGPDPIWTPNTLESIEDAAEGLKLLTIAPPAGAADSFTIGGQYLQIREPGAEKAGIFAISSAPGKKGSFEFLVKEQPPSDWSPGTGWLTDAEAGLKLEMSQVMGPGFPVAEKLADCSTVLMFCVGSGIAPIRSVIESGVLQGKTARLYYGCKTPLQMSYQDKFKEWFTKYQVRVTPTISQPDGTAKFTWAGENGYVQDVAAAQKLGDPASTGVLLCGTKPMAEGVKAWATGVGIAEEKCLTNF